MVAIISSSVFLRRAAAIAVACGVGLTSACYHYAPVPLSSLTPAMDVQVELSAVAVDRIRHGPDSLSKLLDGFTVSGTVSRLEGDSVLLSVPKSVMEANVRLVTQTHNLPILRSEVQGVRSRRLDRARTTWTGVAIGALAAGAVVYVLNHGGESSGSNGKTPDPSELRALPIWQPR